MVQRDQFNVISSTHDQGNAIFITAIFITAISAAVITERFAAESQFMRQYRKAAHCNDYTQGTEGAASSSEVNP
jgi:hypothetical protein